MAGPCRSGRAPGSLPPPHRVGGWSWSQASLRGCEETKWLLSPPDPQGDAGWGRSTQKEEQRAAPALELTWKGRGAGAVAVGCQTGAPGVSLGLVAAVGVQGRNARKSSLGHRGDPPQFISDVFAV